MSDENDGLAKTLEPMRLEIEFRGVDNGYKKVWIYDPEPNNMNQHKTLMIMADSAEEAKRLFPQLMAAAASALHAQHSKIP